MTLPRRRTPPTPPVGRASGSSPSAAGTAWRRACGRCAGSPTGSRPWSASPTTAGPAAGCAASSACCRRATCGWRCRRCAGTTTWGRTWSRVVQHRFGGDGRAAGPRRRQPAHRALWEETGDVVAGPGLGRRPARRARPGAAGVARSRCEIVALTSAASTRPTRTRCVGPRPGGGGDDPGRRAAACASTPPTRPACPEAVEAVRVRRRPRARSRVLVHLRAPHLLVPDSPRRSRTTTAQRVLVLNLAAQPGETERLRAGDPPGGAGASTSRGCARRRPGRPARTSPTCRRPPSARAASWARRLVLEQVAASRTRRAVGVHDPDLLAAAFSTVLGRGRDLAGSRAWR